jgi:hypothetical protein
MNMPIQDFLFGVSILLFGTGPEGRITPSGKIGKGQAH